MASKQTTEKPSGVTRGQKLVIGALAVVLLAVLYVQLKPSGDVDDAAAPIASARRVPRTPRGARPRNEPVDPVATDEELAELEIPVVTGMLEQALWRSADLSTATQYDPFALPAAFPQPVRLATADELRASAAADAADESPAEDLTTRVERLQMELEELRQRGVRVIVKQSDHYAAMIGDRTVHVGDEINGFTITAIEPHGVRVERKVQP